MQTIQFSAHAVISELLVIAVVVLHVIVELVVLSLASASIRCFFILCRKLVVALFGMPRLARTLASLLILTKTNNGLKLTYYS